MQNRKKWMIAIIITFAILFSVPIIMKILGWIPETQGKKANPDTNDTSTQIQLPSGWIYSGNGTSGQITLPNGWTYTQPNGIPLQEWIQDLEKEYS